MHNDESKVRYVYACKRKKKERHKITKQHKVTQQEAAEKLVHSAWTRHLTEKNNVILLLYLPGDEVKLCVTLHASGTLKQPDANKRHW